MAPVTEEQINALLPQAHEAFRLIVALDEFMENNSVKLTFRKRVDWEMCKEFVKKLLENHTYQELYDELTTWLKS